MNDRDLDSAGENAALNVGARVARVVLIEPRASFRECLARAPMTFLPHVSIEGVKSSDEVAPGPAKLVLIGPDLLSGCERWQLRETIETLRRLSDGSPDRRLSARAGHARRRVAHDARGRRNRDV